MRKGAYLAPRPPEMQEWDGLSSDQQSLYALQM
jgi:hypothetical protein